MAGEAWGYFILTSFLVMMCADALVLAVVAVFPTPPVQFTGERPFVLPRSVIRVFMRHTDSTLT